MDRTWQSAEYDKWFVPYHQEVLSAHQSHFCLRAIAEDRGFQSDVSDIQTETEQIYQAAYHRIPPAQNEPVVTFQMLIT